MQIRFLSLFLCLLFSSTAGAGAPDGGRTFSAQDWGIALAASLDSQPEYKGDSHQPDFIPPSSPWLELAIAPYAAPEGSVLSGFVRAVRATQFIRGPPLA